MREKIRRIVPKPLLEAYNHTVSKFKIRKRLGSSFDINWNRRAKQATDADWVKTYDQSWDFWADHDLSPEDLDRLSERVGTCKSLLDAGCGNGYLLNRLKDQADFVVGADLSKVGLDLTKISIGDSIDGLAQAFLENLPFKDKAFEVVVSSHVLEHVKNIDTAIKELKRVTERKLIILVPSQEEKLYTEDYHIHYFPKESDLLKRINHPGATCERFHVPEGKCAFSGDILIVTAMMNKT